MEELTAEQIATYRNDLHSGGKAARRAFETLSARWAAWMQEIAGSANRSRFVQGWREIRLLLRYFLTPFLPEQATIAQRLHAARNAMWERRDTWAPPDNPGTPAVEWICALALEGLFPHNDLLTNLSDAQLMALTKYARRDTAYSLLYSKHAGPAYGRCRQWGAPPERAQDVVQQAFLRTWLSRYTYRTGAPFAPFFYTVLWHEFLKASTDAAHYRSAQPADPFLVDDPMLAPLYPPVVGPDEQLLFEELRQYVSRGVSSLPPRERAVVELWLQDHSEREIATTLGIPRGTVHHHKVNATMKIREYLRTALEDE